MCTRDGKPPFTKGMRRITRAIALAVLVVATACGKSNPSEPSGKGVVLYQVTGTARHVALTFQNSTGGTDQRGSTLPFTYSWNTAKANDFLYISAQIDTSPDPGNITVTISKDGRVAYSANAISFPNIATASGSY